MQLTSLVKNGKITTTPKRAKVLKAYADSFFSSLLSLYEKGDEAYAQREAIRIVKATIYGEEDGKGNRNFITKISCRRKKIRICCFLQNRI